MLERRIAILPPAAALLFLLLAASHPSAQTPPPAGANGRAQTPAEEKRIERPVPSWLLLGPFEAVLPAFAADRRGGFGLEALLRYEELDAAALKPALGRTVRWSDGEPRAWTEIPGGLAGAKLGPVGDAPASAYLAAYIEVPRYTRARVVVATGQLFQAWLDGGLVAVKARSDKEGRTAIDLKLETGSHALLLKTVYDPGTKTDWRVGAVLEFGERFADPGPRLTTAFVDTVSLRHVLDAPRPIAVSVSPEGTCVALTMSRALPPSDEIETWLELHQIESGRSGLTARLAQTFRGGAPMTNIAWAPKGRRFSYSTFDKNGGTIWLADQASGLTVPLLRDVKLLGPHVWAPDGMSLLYSVTEESPPESSLAKRFQTLEDRQPGWRNRSHIHRLVLPDGVRSRLTSGELSAGFGGFSPDGKKILFTRQVVDMSERPYSRTELFTLDLASLREELLWSGRWFNGARWSPDGKSILLLGGPSMFGSVGRNVPSSRIPNDYDTQAYLFDLASRKAEPLTRDFHPSIARAFWPSGGETAYVLAADAAFARLFEFVPGNKGFTALDGGVEVIEQADVAAAAPIAALIGSGASSPPKVFLLDLRRRETRLLKDPDPETAAGLKTGKVEPWTFRNRSGVEIDGFVLYPPDFDPARKYPLIVNYYGGTSPVTRDFGGRYPKAYYAAQGYVVYVLEPSGAVGYGQEFSALHVNDWGTIVAEEIIEGARRFLAAHPFVDPRRVGCIGASYGGFMTMLLTTKTSMFASAVSHAGISSISSYWGEGYWGYSYGATAAADSFPWNRRDIFITQSPLFNADKITTPLLLLHGAADTNVPPGESTQLFTALKLLGREVEYIQFYDQNHHVLTYNKRVLWTKTILAWFDRWLKNQPEWWFDLYPQR